MRIDAFGSLGKLCLLAAWATAALSAGGCRKAECGNGAIERDEVCDDGNVAAGDGCAAACTVEPGFTCAGEPSICTATTGDVCGDGAVGTSEACDDDNTTAGDGCDASCAVEPGFMCTGEPSVCTATTGDTCGDGLVGTTEACDDGNTAAGDGCDGGCAVEAGFTCTGEPSVCTATTGDTCGDGVVGTTEGCDDGNAAAGDGCDDFCAVEAGFVCTGEPSVCVADTCGSGLIGGGESCDDGNTANGDGCDDTCAVEAGWLCSGEPSVCCQDECAALGDSQCDVGGLVILDCMLGADLCFDLVPGTDCSTTGEVCDDSSGAATCTVITAVCGDGTVQPPEQCDDGGTVAGDGCSGACTFEATCGNGTVEPGEGCDDGGTTAGDGCDGLCQLEAGTTCGDAVDLNDPANVSIFGATTVYDGDTTGSALTDFGNPSCAGGTGGVPSVLHRYTMQSNGFLTLETINVGGALVDTVIFAYSDCLDNTSEIACDDDSSPDGLYSLETTAIYAAGTPLFIVVAGYGGADVGPYELQITESTVYDVPASGTCAAPVVIGGSGTYAGETLATDAALEAGTCVGGATPEAVFEMTLAGTSDVTIVADPVNPLFDIGVYMRDSPCGTGAEVDCSDIAGDGGPDTIGATDLPAGTYYIVVDGFVAGDVGTYQLNVDIVSVIPSGGSCTPGDPSERCEVGTYCGGTAVCAAPTTLLLETFDSSLGPLTASDVDMDGVGWVWCDDGGTCTTTNPTGSASGGGFALADDPTTPATIFEEAITTPALDCSALISVTVEFDHFFDNTAGPPDAGIVQVSTDGVVWTDVATYAGGDVTGHEVIDVSASAAGQATFYVRFLYDENTTNVATVADDWEVDDLFIWGY